MCQKPHVLVGGDDDDELYGEKGRDQLFGEAGNDMLFGGDDDDQIAGWEGDDKSYGEAGRDVLIASPGTDELHGGLDDDIYVFPRRDEQSLDDNTLFENPAEGEDSVYLPPEVGSVTINSSSAAPQAIGPNSRVTLQGGGANFENYWTDDAPDSPEEFDVSSTSSTQIDLAWQPTSDLSGYKIERLESGGDWQVIYELQPNTNNASTYSDTAVSSGDTYDYRIIRETIDGGSSEYSYQRATAEDLIAALVTETIAGLDIIHPSNVSVVSGDIGFLWSKLGTGKPSLQDALMGDSIVDAGVGHHNGATPIVNYDFEPNTLINGPGDDFVFFAISATSGGFSISAPGAGQISAGGTTFLGEQVEWYLVNGGAGGFTHDILYAAYDLSDLGIAEGASVDRLVLNSPSSGDWAGIGAIQHPKLLEIVVQSFIPLQGENNQSTIGSLFGYFATDPRVGIDATPGAEDNDYRTRLYVAIDTTDSSIIASSTDAGITKEYKDEEGTILIGQAEAQEGQDMFHNFKARPFRSFGDEGTLITLGGEATDPLLTMYHQLINGSPNDSYLEMLGDMVTFPLTIGAPAVNFKFVMNFDPVDEALKVYGFSTHDGFPSYEIFVRYDGGAWENIYFWDSKAEKQSPYAMFGDGEFEKYVDEFIKDFTP